MLNKIKHHVLDVFKTDHVLNEFILKYQVLINELEQTLISLNFNKQKVNQSQLTKASIVFDEFTNTLISFIGQNLKEELNPKRIKRYNKINSLLIHYSNRYNKAVTKPMNSYCLGSVRLKDSTVLSTNNSGMSNLFEAYKVASELQKDFEKVMGKKIVIS
jgi:hypothetical protein